MEKTTMIELQPKELAIVLGPDSLALHMPHIEDFDNKEGIPEYILIGFGFAVLLNDERAATEIGEVISRHVVREDLDIRGILSSG